ncbi:transcriptional repressor LexA [soil metagenome]
MGEELGARGVEILGFLARRSMRGEGSPSQREVASAVGFRSSRSGHVHLTKLEEGGYVERETGRARGIKLTRRGWGAALAETPFLGRIAAGRGLEAVSVGDDAYSLVAELLISRSGRERYLLRVVGQSMVEAGIEEGDLLVIEEDESPPGGTVVIALLEEGEEVTVKRLFRENGLIRLQAENPGHGDIVIPAEKVRIQGQVIYVIHSPRA